MAPSLISGDQPSQTASEVRQGFDTSIHEKYKYAAYLPVFDTTTQLPPLDPFPVVDKGTLADKSKPHLFSTDINPNVSIAQLTPRIGTEIAGLQLSQLSDVQKNELALLVAERGVVVFRGQDFKDIGPDKQKALGEYFGKLHVHPVEAQVRSHPELYSIYLGPDNLHRAQRMSSRLTTVRFHSDVSYEHQPPAITILTMLQAPSTGGDTAWASQVVAYERLSDPIKRLLEGLRAEHSGARQAEQAIREGKNVIREPVISQHPIVRVHPATGEKALFVNISNTKRIVGLKEEESEALLQLLFRHLSSGQDFQVRVRWDDQTVVLWDNRVTVHTPISDYDVTQPAEGFRHAFRITTIGEKPLGVNGLDTVW